MTEQEYKKEIDFIFNRFPSYQKAGKTAYKPGIETMHLMDAVMGHPHRKFISVHIAGTNGKGSVSHMLASALMRVEYPDLLYGTDNIIRKRYDKRLRVGLYTSPHLADFRERIKIDGEMVSKQFVYDFILKYKELFLVHDASFFEITTAMAFSWFAMQGVDIAVIECGLGGRLDSTNIITPVLSVITNIGLDHCEYLGYSYKEIAAEKAGIIKSGVPVVIGERGGSYPDISFVAPVFEEKAAAAGSVIRFAEDKNAGKILAGFIDREGMDLQGACQDKNIKTVCTALSLLAGERFINRNMCKSMAEGIGHAARDTGLRGRWEKLNDKPLVICDTGHNAHGFALLGEQIKNTAAGKGRLFMVFGIVADKDTDSIRKYLPDNYGNGKRAYYYYVNVSGSRALPAALLAEKMKIMGFEGEAVADEKGVNICRQYDSTVIEGVKKALNAAQSDDFIFIGGSTFVVAEALEYFNSGK